MLMLVTTGRYRGDSPIYGITSVIIYIYIVNSWSQLLQLSVYICVQVFRFYKNMDAIYKYIRQIQK